MTHPLIKALTAAGEHARRVAGNLAGERLGQAEACQLIEACGVDRFAVPGINDQFTINDRSAPRAAVRDARARIEWRTEAAVCFASLPELIQRDALAALARGDGGAFAGVLVELGNAVIVGIVADIQHSAAPEAA
jgi:hypothetical protein